MGGWVGEGQCNEERVVTYNGDNAVRFEQGVEVLQKLEGEQSDGLGAAREDVVDDVVKARLGLVSGQASSVANCVFDHGRMIAGELEVLGGELVNYRVQFYHGGINTVRYESGWSGADTKTAEECQQGFKGDCFRGPYMTSAFASLSRIRFGVLTSRTASSMANTP